MWIRPRFCLICWLRTLQNIFPLDHHSLQLPVLVKLSENQQSVRRARSWSADKVCRLWTSLLRSLLSHNYSCHFTCEATGCNAINTFAERLFTAIHVWKISRVLSPSVSVDPTDRNTFAVKIAWITHKNWFVSCVVVGHSFLCLFSDKLREFLCIWQERPLGLKHGVQQLLFFQGWNRFFL